jgi:hypothetical protein
MDAVSLRRTPSIQPNQGNPSSPREGHEQDSVPVVISRGPTDSINLAVDAHDKHASKVASEPHYSSGEKPVTNAPEVSKQPQSHSDEGTNAEVHTGRNSNRRNKQAGSRKSKQGAVKQKLAPKAASCASTGLLQLLHSSDKADAISAVNSHLRNEADRPKGFYNLLALACQNKNFDKASLLLSIRTEVLGSQHSTATRDLRAAILATAGTENAPLLNELLDAHPHARRDPADRSVGTRVSNFFRKMTSWLGSDAAKWQRKEGKSLLQAVARTGNAQSMEILLTRCFDLVNDRRAIEQALKLAVDSNNPETTKVLLERVLSDRPAYSEGAALTTMAAHAGNAEVLKVLISSGMALPAETEWPRYFADIEFDLRQKAAERGNW